MVSGPDEAPIFTCLSCTIAFTSAEDQRVHYRSDHHRYNMKRRVAGLPPVSSSVFNQKVLELCTETTAIQSPKDLKCDACGKTYTTENAYKCHMSSRKHEKSVKAPLQALKTTSTTMSMSAPSEPPGLPPLMEQEIPSELERAIDAKIGAARIRLGSDACLFCPNTSTSIDANLEHMSTTHSFFIPDAEYLIDLPGLLTYLGEKIAVGNICIYCNGRGRELHTLEATRKHMHDKSHCKIAYDTEADRLEVSDFYDFTRSYPDNDLRRKGKGGSRLQGDVDDEAWEDIENDDSGGAEDLVDEDASNPDTSESEGLPHTRVTYGDTEFELVLPSGARIGHRSMKRYYDQSFYGIRPKEQDPNSGAALVRRLLADKNSALVPRGGGFGAFGRGMEVVKAKNKGEAREAQRHIREYRDQRRKEEFRTRIGFIHNNQKHYRDPLLQ